MFEFDQYLANKLGNQLHLPPSDRAAVLSGKEKANLIDLLWKFEATEQIRNMLAAYFEFLPEFRLASSKIGIARSFDVDKVVFGRVKGDDIKLALGVRKTLFLPPCSLANPKWRTACAKTSVAL